MIKNPGVPVRGTRLYPPGVASGIEHFDDLVEVEVYREGGTITVALNPRNPADDGYGIEFDMTPAAARKFARNLNKEAKG